MLLQNKNNKITFFLYSHYNRITILMNNFDLIKSIFWRLIPKKVYGLVGPAGTGKSFRAFLIADKYKINFILDDGLLIKGQKIIAGKSAKEEQLKVRAIKRAIFHEIPHAREVRKKLHQEHFTSLLILATSDGMLYKIAKRLHLPKPSKIIRIEDIATKDEIKKAQKLRKHHGKHVIPLPLIEVKKQYPNIVLDAIHFFVDDRKGFFFKKKQKRLIEKTIVRPTYGNFGKITISEEAIAQMVSHCIAEYSRLIKLLKIVISKKENEYTLKLNIEINYNLNNPELIKEIQNMIKSKIEDFTGISIQKIDINISKITV